MYGNSGMPIAGTFNAQRVTAASGAFFALIPPYMGDGPLVQTWPSQSGGIYAKQYRGKHKTHVNKVIYSTGSAAHVVVIARPFNFSVVSAAVAAGATTIPLCDDPGVYSTNYKYSTLVIGSAPGQVANNPIGSGHYIAVQLADGTWKATTATGGSYTGLTVPALPNNNSVGINKGALLYFYGTPPTDLDPATGFANPQTQIASSQTRDTSWWDYEYGVVTALHAGDPLLFYSPNTTNQGYLEQLSGFYSER